MSERRERRYFLQNSFDQLDPPSSFLPLEINQPESDFRELLIKNVSENVHYIMFLTQDEAYAILKELTPIGGYDISERNLDRLGYTATYAGNTRDGISITKIIWELKGFGVQAHIYKARNGQQMVKITGYAGVRRILMGTNYKLTNMQIVNIGIGQKGINNNIISGMKFCIYVGLAYRTLEYIFRDVSSTEEFLGKVASDVAKVIVATAAMKVAATVLMGIAGFTLGGALCVVVIASIVLTYSLEYIDEKLGITEAIIIKIAEMQKNTPQISETLGRDSQLLFKRL